MHTFDKIPCEHLDSSRPFFSPPQRVRRDHGILLEVSGLIQREDVHSLLPMAFGSAVMVARGIGEAAEVVHRESRRGPTRRASGSGLGTDFVGKKLPEYSCGQRRIHDIGSKTDLDKYLHQPSTMCHDWRRSIYGPSFLELEFGAKR